MVALEAPHLVDRIDAMARAGFEAYHDGDPVRPWAALHGHERHRWTLAVAAAAETGPSNPERIRAAYLEGVYVPAWSEVGQAYRIRWRTVALAMDRARDGVR